MQTVKIMVVEIGVCLRPHSTDG